MYKHEKIILVNSGDQGYVEIPLDRHTLLKASGNKGKSSVLNALKLLWLPETSFAGCESKFKFQSKSSDSGYYSGEESFSHYFPSSSRSFVIGEYNNYHGAHCQILYPSTGKRFGRILVKAAYSQIEDLFWNKEEETEDGMGAANDSLSTTSLLASLKEREIEFVQVTKSDELKSLLYSDSLMDSDSEYSIFPLKSDDDTSIADLVTILHALAGAKTDSKGMAALFASIIESKKKDSSDHLNMDLQDILQERDTINGEESLLNQLEGYRSDANAVAAICSRLDSAPDTIGVEVLSAKASIEASQVTLLEKISAMSKQLADENADKKKCKDSKDRWTTHHASLKGVISEKKKAYTKAVELKERGDYILNEEYSAGDWELEGEDGIIAFITEDRDHKKSLLETLVKEEDLTKRIGALELQQSVLAKKIAEKTQAIDNFESILVNQLEGHTAQVLASINPTFRTITTNNVADGVIEALDAFASIFESNGDTLTLCGVSIPVVSSSTSISELQEQQHILKNELSDITVDLDQLKAYKRGDAKQREKSIKEHREFINKCNADIKLLRNYETLLEEFPSIEKEYLETQAQLDNALEEKNKCAEHLKSLQASIKDKDQAVKLLNSQADANTKLLERIKQVSIDPIFAVMLSHVDTNKIKSCAIVDKEALDKVSTKAKPYLDDVMDLRTKLVKLVSQAIIEDDAKVCFDVSSNFYQLVDVAKKLKEKFDQIEPRRENLKDSKAAHKSIIAMKMQELQSNAEVIEHYQKTFNKMYQEVSINDLEGVKIIMNLDTRFNDLIAQIEANDLHGDEEISESFYDRLSTFVNAFFSKGQSAELTMNRIIKSVTFEVKKKDKDWVATGQSNSTGTLISVTLLQKMLKEKFNPDIEIRAPLVIDELAHIDESEIDWVLRNLESDGFRLLGACTNNISMHTQDAIGSECVLDEFQSARVYTKGLNSVFYHQEGEVSE